MAPILNLSPDCIDKPTRLDLATVEAMMLWPDDKAKRDEAEESSVMQEMQSQFRKGNLPECFIRSLADSALDTRPPAQIQEAAKKRFVQGVAVGRIIRNAITLRDIAPDQAAIGRSVEHVSEILWPEWPLSPKTINNKVLPRFRPVAHFWAVYVDEYIEGRKTFPCRVRDLSMFLATAEAYRQIGETIRTPRAPSTVLKPGEAVQIPNAVLCHLRKVTVEFKQEAAH